jgi:hypothetical protein
VSILRKQDRVSVVGELTPQQQFDANPLVKEVYEKVGPQASDAIRQYDDMSPAQVIALSSFREDVCAAKRLLRVREAAKDELRAENQPPALGFDAGMLGAILARPPEPAMRIEGLIPWEASTLIVAMRKTGKTTLTLNLIRSLLTGEDFLGRFKVKPIDGNIAFLNYEVSGATLARWADEQGIDRDRLYIVNLRGRRNPLAHIDDRHQLIGEFQYQQIESLFVDPFSRAFTGTNQNDSGEAAAFLADLDLFARAEVGASDLILTAHAGWAGERTRGSSALEDWPDSIITMTRDPVEESKRFLKAIGRDVDVDEDLLDFDPTTRTLSLSGAGSRRQHQSTRKLVDLAVFAVRAAHEHPGVGVAEMEQSIRNMDGAPTFRNGDVSKAAKRAQEQGHMRIDGGGPGRKSQHFAVDKTTVAGRSRLPIPPITPIPTPPREQTPTHPTPSYKGGVGVGGGAWATRPEQLGGVPDHD